MIANAVSLLLITFLCSIDFSFSQKALSKTSGPPPFFLQDPTDGQCLCGSTYKRCSLNTLWYVVGKPGSYQIHHRLVEDEEDETCLSKLQCHLESSNASLLNCNHCGAKKWNIVGDSETGKAVDVFNYSSLIFNCNEIRLRVDRR
jgi:hypothetical protein